MPSAFGYQRNQAKPEPAIETPRCAQGDNITLVILSEAKNPNRQLFT
jgi:hypothetical protein